MIYLDYAATTPLLKEAAEVYTEIATSYYGNAISLHNIGTTAKELLETSRKQLADLLNVESEGIYFTSGGSESNILALESIIKGQKQRGKHIISSTIEHASIFNYLQSLKERGFEITYLPVDRYGMINPEDVKKAIREDTILATIHYGNGELATVQNIKTIGSILRKYKIIFHSDCAQTFGKLPLDLQKLPLDSISISSPKLYGPKGVGAVYIRPDVRWLPKYEKTTHENGFKPGTVNVAGVASFITSAKKVINDMIEENKRLFSIRNYFVDKLNELDYDISVEGHPTNVLPHIIPVRIIGMEGQFTMLELNRYHIAISTGSACLVGQDEPPRVMKALGYSDAEAIQFVRFSMGKSTTIEKIDKVIVALEQILKTFFAKNKRNKIIV